MKFNLGLLATLFAASAVTAKNVCETSDASPYLHNVNEMIDNLKNAEMGKNACNFATNGCGETITAYSGSGGAAFMLCGGSFRVSKKIRAINWRGRS